jgi:iron(III) transport system permease protein
VQPGRRLGSRSRVLLGQGRLTVAVSAVISIALLLPLPLLALDARGAGWAEVRRVLWRQRSAFLLGNTVQLAALAIVFATTLGVGAAWCTERTRLPGRRVWTVLLVVPVALPDFVVGFAWHSFAPRMAPLLAATLVMTLGTYPLVYLPAAAALRRADPGMEEVAQSLGAGKTGVLLRVTVPLIRTAALGGAVLVALTVISEYGAFEILRYQTFTTEIFTEFQFDPDSAGALSIPLVVLGLVVLGTDAVIPRHTTAKVRRRPPTPRRTTGGLPPTVFALGALVLLAVGVPLGTLAYWMAHSRHTTLPAAATLSQATSATLGYSAGGAAISVLLALPVAMMGFRKHSRIRILLERGTYVTQALPGVVIALSLVFLATRYAFALYQSSLLLVIAYAILHFPLALVCVKTSVAQAPAQLADIARSLGRGPVPVFLLITLPLLAAGLLAGFCLVFLTAVTELTATLVLAPIGVQTLATQFWAYQNEVAYGAAAPYALVIVAIAMVPGALLGLWFDHDRQSR